MKVILVVDVFVVFVIDVDVEVAFIVVVDNDQVVIASAIAVLLFKRIIAN